MSKLKKLLPKRDLRARWLWVLAQALTAVKLGLCSFQLIAASPDLSPIDDTLMFNLAKSISAGNWLGEYDWLTLGKHSFYALWLAFLNLLHVNIVVGGQALFAVSCLVLLAALKPVMRTNWGRLFVFAVTLYTPASWAENTLRVYRDNIYPSLVLLALAGLLGAFTRFREKPLRALPYYVAASLSLAASWLCYESNPLLLAFFLCSAAVYLAYLFLDKSIAHKKSRLALLLVPLALWGGGIAAWCGMNYKYYGRFIISDFTSSEFNDAMGALSRAYPDDQKRYELIPLSTRLALYEVSPTFAKLQDVLETPEMYNGYGDPETGDLNACGIHWVLRKAAWTAGYYDTAQDAENFWRAVADEINAACDAGLVPAGRRHSGVFSPIKAEYVAPTIGKFFDEVKVFVLFEQTEPTQILSIARPDQTEEWESYLHCQSTIAAQANTDLPYFAPLNQIAYKLLNLVTWVQRILLWPMLRLTVLWLVRYAPACVRGLKKKQPPADLAGSVLMLLISAEAYKNETFRMIAGSPSYTLPKTNKCKAEYPCHNHHKMIYPFRGDSSHLYKYCTGGKTGYTTVANNTLVSFAEKDGITLVCVVMDAATPDHYTDTRKLFDYCFENFQALNISENDAGLAKDNGKNYGVLNNSEPYVKLDEDAYIIMPKGAQFSDVSYKKTESAKGKKKVARLAYTYATQMSRSSSRETDTLHANMPSVLSYSAQTYSFHSNTAHQSVLPELPPETYGGFPVFSLL